MQKNRRVERNVDVVQATVLHAVTQHVKIFQQRRLEKPQKKINPAALSVTERAYVQRMLQSIPSPTDFCLQSYSHTKPHFTIIEVSTSTIHVNTWITTHYRSKRDGRLSWPSWLTNSRQFTHKLVTCQP